MKPFSVLFVCARNAGLSIMAEAYLNHLALPGVMAFSAGLDPAERVDPRALTALSAAGIETDRLEPKPVELFTFEHAPRPDVVVELGSGPLGTAPLWHHPARRLSWRMGDPLTISARASFAEAYDSLCQRIDRAMARVPAGRALLVPRRGLPLARRRFGPLLPALAG
ncbi:hypothetical protein [Pseudoxanthobacter sp.]|uniref:arsenate-mycothiol transferase ArsC n=1 Tax=Pseudoxanthobacter sp. TaxID=1925742 RepID=UPI002FE249DB